MFGSYKGRPCKISDLHCLIGNHPYLVCILYFQNRRRLFINIRVEQVLNLLEYNVEFLLLLPVFAVVELGSKVAAEVVQVVESHHYRFAGRYFPNDLLVILVEAQQVVEDQLPLGSGQFEWNFLAGLNLFLGGHIRFLVVLEVRFYQFQAVTARFQERLLPVLFSFFHGPDRDHFHLIPLTR